MNRKDANIKNIRELIIYLVRYRTKEFLLFIVIFLVAWILTMNVSYDKEHGLQWRPAAKIDVKIQKSLDSGSSSVAPEPFRAIPDAVKKPENAVSVP